jgi:hypothetical protein
MTSLGSWDGIERNHQVRHGMTFPLAILAAVLADAGLPVADVWEGEDKKLRGPWTILLVSMMDPRHMWRLAPWLYRVHCPVLAADRAENDPIVVVGGQAATAPEPIAHLADVIYIGDAEAHAVDLLLALDGAGTRRQRLERAAAIPGCYVPSAWDGAPILKVESADIGITLRHQISVSTNNNPRIELARGCRSKCGFCVLGWRASYRENPLPDVVGTIDAIAATGARQMHLSAGDAESYSDIDAVRRRLAGHGVRDHSWTGRLDTLNDCSVTPGKLFAFGIEGLSHRLRRAVGKPRLTDEFIATEIADYWRMGGRRILLHMIGGLPTECDDDAASFGALLQRLDAAAREHVPEGAILEIARQPFGPLPHTPMQWFAPGLQTDRIGRVVAPYASQGAMRVIDKSGQTYQNALLNSVVMRGGSEVQSMVTAGPPSLSPIPAVALAEYMIWMRQYGLDPRRYLDAWDPSDPTPWDHVLMPDGYGREAQQRAYRRIASTLGMVVSA